MKESKNLDESLKIRLDNLLTKLKHIFGQAKLKQSWIFKETEKVFKFLEEFMDILYKLRHDLTVKVQSSVLCCKQ